MKLILLPSQDYLSEATSILPFRFQAPVASGSNINININISVSPIFFANVHARVDGLQYRHLDLTGIDRQRGVAFVKRLSLSSISSLLPIQFSPNVL